MYEIEDFEIGGFYHITAVIGSNPMEVLIYIQDIFDHEKLDVSINGGSSVLKIVMLAAINQAAFDDPYPIVPRYLELGGTLNHKIISVKKVGVKDFPLYIGWDMINPILYDLIKGETME